MLPTANRNQANYQPKSNPPKMKTPKITFRDAINWEYVHAHHKAEDGKVVPGDWCRTIIAHAHHNGYTGKITERGACRIITANLY